MDKLEALLLEAETVSVLMIHMSADDVGDTSFAVMSDLGENGTEHECDLGVSETALRASAVITALLAELEAKDREIDAANARVDVMCARAMNLTERAEFAEKQLATPVRLPEGLAQKIKVTGYYEALNEMMDCVRAAGFKCVGD